MTPLLAFVILRRRVHLSVIISVAISVIGFYLLCVTDGFGSITLADMVLLFTAVLFAGHILVIDTFGRDMDPILLSFGQITTTAIISWIGSIIEDPSTGPVPRKAGSPSSTRASAPLA